MRGILDSFEGLGLHLPRAKARAVAYLLNFQRINQRLPAEGAPGRICEYCHSSSPVRTVKMRRLPMTCAMLCLECQSAYYLAHESDEKGIPMSPQEKSIWENYRAAREGV